jgi:hypothetical protein
VRFGCEGLVVFWGGCVVFWCSFWVGFWLSESLRGVFTPARNGRLQPLPPRGRGGYGVRKRSFRPMLKLTLQHSIGSARASPLPLRGRGAGGEGYKKCASPARSELKLGLYQSQGQSLQLPPPLGSPRFARGTEPRARSVPLACRGSLKEEIFNLAGFVNFAHAIGIIRASAQATLFACAGGSRLDPRPPIESRPAQRR